MVACARSRAGADFGRTVGYGTEILGTGWIFPGRAPLAPKCLGRNPGIGFDTTVTIRSRKLTWLRGFIIYLVAVLQTIILNHEAPRMKIITDTEEWEDENILFVIGNGNREGGGFHVTPDARPDDGLGGPLAGADRGGLHPGVRPGLPRTAPAPGPGGRGGRQPRGYWGHLPIMQTSLKQAFSMNFQASRCGANWSARLNLQAKSTIWA